MRGLQNLGVLAAQRADTVTPLPTSIDWLIQSLVQKLTICYRSNKASEGCIDMTSCKLTKDL